MKSNTERTRPAEPRIQSGAQSVPNDFLADRPANDKTRPVSERQDPSGNDERRARWAGLGALLLTALTVGLAASRRYHAVILLIPLYADWSLLLAAVQICGLMVLLWRYGRPSTFRGWAVLAGLNCGLAAVAV